jgi:Arc/MetJ family transcription regulator
LTLCDNTERPEIITIEANELIGTDPSKLGRSAGRRLSPPTFPDMGASSIDTHIDTGYRMGINSLRMGDDTMKTTIEIDQQLLRQAQKTLGTDTIKGTVEASLRTVIQHSQLQKLANALGTIPLDLTPGQLRSQRHKRPSHVSR